ncbi:MAG: BadF/BadG/BcrA/BcrD ATPase family protein [Eubacteriales bacterium]|nr:BadF/BadG/BcrA/BcrD ATPase family protein [Eubacteriales bacterium]
MIAGIDGGGTSTKLELRDDDNQPICRMKFGPFNVSAVGIEGVRSVIDEMAKNVELSGIRRFCIGGAGVSYDGLGELLRKQMSAHGFVGQLRLCSDFEIALRGAMKGPGGILIAGTGSVAFGNNDVGAQARVGGWGHLIDDAGSGYTIGRDALAVTVRAEDGRMDADMLRHCILYKIGGRDNQDVLNYVYYSGRDKSAVAALAAVVLHCAEEGDAISVKLLENNAAQLLEIVMALVKRLQMNRPRIALLGGLLANDTLYGRIVREALRPVCETPEPEHDALWGAAQLAWEME